MMLTKTIVVFISISVVVSAISDDQKWDSFKSKHGKYYKSLREETQRFKIFQTNLRRIESHNEKYERGEETYKLGVNQFADFTEEELSKRYSMPAFQIDEPSARFPAKPGVTGPPSVDWRTKGVVFDVGNVDACGSSWAFAGAGSLEGINAIKHNLKERLSVQELVDCTTSYGNWGCHGGLTNNVYKYVKDHGLSAWNEYPYADHDQTCKNSSISRVDLNITGYTVLNMDEEALRQAVEKIGPISTSFCSHYDLWYYEGGIFDPKYNCCKNANEAILAVGYGTENDTDYWIMKNSWGTEWGENGYLRIVRNKNNTCGIVTMASYPIVG